MPTKVDNVKIRMSAEGAAAVASQLKGIDAGIAGMANAVKGLGGLFAAQQLGQFLGDSIREAAESERSMNRLAATIKRLGGDVAGTTSHIDNFAKQLQRESEITDEQAVDAVNRLVVATRDLEKAKLAVRAAADLAASTDMEFESAVTLLTRATQGSTEMFQRYGIEVKKGASDGESFSNALKAINEQFGGAAIANIDTAAGKINQLTKSWDEFKESVGTAVINTGILDGIGKAVEMFGKGIAVALNRIAAVDAESSGDFLKLWKAARDLVGVASPGGAAPSTPAPEKGLIQVIAKQAEAAKKSVDGLLQSFQQLKVRTDPNDSLDALARADMESITNEGIDESNNQSLQRWNNLSDLKVQKSQESWDAIKAQAEEAATFMTGIAGQFTDAFVDGIMGMKVDVEQLFRDMVSNMIKELLRLAVFKFLTALLTGGTSSAGAFFLPGGAPTGAPSLALGGASTSLSMAPVYNINVTGGAYAHETAMAVQREVARLSRNNALSINTSRAGQTQTGFPRSMAWNTRAA